MLSGSRKILGFVVVLAILSSSAALRPASADILKYLGPAYGGYVSTTGLENSPSPPLPVSDHPGAGAFSILNLTAGGGSFAAWCVDIYSLLNTSSSGTSYTLTPGTEFFGGSQVTALERLASQHLASISTVTDSGAFQLAVWEIVYESSGTYDLGSGNFQIASASGNALATANAWLSALGDSTPTLTLAVWTSSSSQDLAVFSAPIPEPEVYAMLLAGLGLMGFVVNRRRGVSAVG